jgi:hypothetical protein
MTAWLCVDENGDENICSAIPRRDRYLNYNFWNVEDWQNIVDLPDGTIKKLIGKKLTWKDEPVKFNSL